MKIVITGKPFRYITEEKIRKITNRVFKYLKEKLPPVLRIGFSINNNYPFQGCFRLSKPWEIRINKTSEKEFGAVLSHELAHFIDYRKRGYKIWNNSYIFEKDVIIYLLNPHEYFAESISVKLYPVPYFVNRFKKVNKVLKKKLKELNEQYKMY